MLATQAASGPNSANRNDASFRFTQTARRERNRGYIEERGRKSMYEANIGRSWSA
jgi:hypothetical protein